jgi:hypothetical protein
MSKDTESHAFHVNPEPIDPGNPAWHGRFTNSCPVAQAIIRTFKADPQHLYVTRGEVHARGYKLTEPPEKMRNWIIAYDMWRAGFGPPPEPARLSITLEKIPEDMPGIALRKDYELTN